MKEERKEDEKDEERDVDSNGDFVVQLFTSEVFASDTDRLNLVESLIAPVFHTGLTSVLVQPRTDLISDVMLKVRLLAAGYLGLSKHALSHGSQSELVVVAGQSGDLARARRV
ncbi:hypothetical protein RRG08_036108 [Elysia crispata]|uniref:Uncharacterized protein n=1 Tax=Elysia crispata TaxID=231223 RepID=A0AAE1AL00_9GAST|nr:hypothetical protein RRG08_036108 [Elysia crispata]